MENRWLWCEFKTQNALLITIVIFCLCPSSIWTRFLAYLLLSTFLWRSHKKYPLLLIVVKHGISKWLQKRLHTNNVSIVDAKWMRIYFKRPKVYSIWDPFNLPNDHVKWFYVYVFSSCSIHQFQKSGCQISFVEKWRMFKLERLLS